MSAVMSEPALRLGTRRSALATAQSTLVADLVRERLGRSVELSRSPPTATCPTHRWPSSAAPASS